MLHWIVIAGFVALAFALASLLATWTYGRFRLRGLGAPGSALPRTADGTLLDRLVEPELQARPGKSGLMLLASNVDAFAARAQLARSAGRSLDLMYYIWEDDLTGRLLLQELVTAADRGVRVRLLLDDVGVGHSNSGMRALAAHPNIEVRLFNPTQARPGGLRRGIEMALRAFSVTRRMHNKAWIADGRIAITGGRNIGDAYFDACETSNFRDLDLMSLGPVTDQVEAMFDEYWNSPAVLPIGGLSTLRRRDAPARQQAALRALAASEEAAPYLQHVRNSNTISALLEYGVHWDEGARLMADPAAKGLAKDADNWLMQQLLPVFGTVRERLEITSPYFIPGVQGTEQFVALAGQGAAVRVLTNSLAATDVAAVHGGYAPYRLPLLKGGIELYELAPDGKSERLSFRGKSRASLHTKAFLIDQTTGFIGSLNFDPRSASLNTEMGVLFSAPGLVAQMHNIFEEEIRPEISWRLGLSPGGRLQWQGAKGVLHEEPCTTLWRRLTAKIVGLLPLESQL